MKPTIQNTLNEKLVNWAQDNAVEILMNSNLTKDLSVDLVKKLATKVDYERVQNYLEEIADAKAQTLKLVELNKGTLPKLIAAEHITDEIIDLMHNLSPSIFPKGAEELKRIEPIAHGETFGIRRDKLARNNKRKEELAKTKNNIATIFNNTTAKKINPMLIEIAKGEVKLPFGQQYTTENVKRIISGLSDKAPRFFSVINELDVIENAQTKAVDTNKAKTVLGQKYQEAINSVNDPVAKGIKGTDCLNAEIEAMLMAEAVALNPTAYKTIEDMNKLKDVIKKAISGEKTGAKTKSKKFIGPATVEESQTERIKESYDRIITGLMRDEVFLKLYNTNDPRSAKRLQETYDALYPDPLVGSFFEPIEAGGVPVAVVPVVEDLTGDILVDAANMFNHAEVHDPVRHRRLARQAERAEIQERIRDEAENNTGRFVGVELLFERAEREAEAREEARIERERQRLEDVANDVVIEGIAGLFEDEEAPVALEVPVVEGGAEEVIVAPIPVEEAPVRGDAREDAPIEEEPREEADEVIERPVMPVDAPAGLTTPIGESKFEDTTESEKAEHDKEEAMKIAAIEEAKRIEEARVVEAARIEASEVAEMQTAVKADKEMIGAIYNPIHDITRMNRDIISHRMMQTALSNAAVAAGDEDERVLDKGVWIAGIYGTNKQGSQGGFAGYKGQASGGTIGFDIGFDNFKDIVGVAYTKLDSKFKSSGSKLNTTIDSHILALYGQKELPKNFMIQAMFAYNHNIVKSKINRLGTIATGKYKNDNYNFETLLSYNHLMKGGITLTPNLGVRYGHSKDGSYQESGVGIQHLSIASKKQNLWSGILGGSVALAPQKIAEGFSITPALQASVENYFNNKSKKLNAKVKWKDREVNETIALPKQPKVGYNIGASVLTEKGNVSVALEYNCHLQKKYQSHQGFVKLKVKL